MTCGMPCVMRRERRGVLHLDKSSPPKINRWGGMEEKKKGKTGKENEQFYDLTNIRVASSEGICTSRGRGSLLLWLIFISEP